MPYVLYVIIQGVYCRHTHHVICLLVTVVWRPFGCEETISTDQQREREPYDRAMMTYEEFCFVEVCSSSSILYMHQARTYVRTGTDVHTGTKTRCIYLHYTK